MEKVEKGKMYKSACDGNEKHKFILRFFGGIKLSRNTVKMVRNHQNECCMGMLCHMDEK